MPHMTKPSLHNTHIHVTDILEQCYTCTKIINGNSYVGVNILTLRDPDLGIIACPRCSKEKII